MLRHLRAAVEAVWAERCRRAATTASSPSRSSPTTGGTRTAPTSELRQARKAGGKKIVFAERPEAAAGSAIKETPLSQPGIGNEP